jgi:hypothetical protein
MFKVTVRDTGNQWRRFNELTIIHNNEVISTHSDSGEPEDNSFYRDYSWIKGMLERAYKFGFEDGAKFHSDQLEK